MQIFRKFAAFITAMAATAFLFVVVSPLTPTPVAVMAGQGNHVPGPAIAALCMAVMSIQLVALHNAGNTALLLQHTTAHPVQGRLVDMTCARLC